MLYYLSATRTPFLDVVEARALGRCFEVQSSPVLENHLSDDDPFGLTYWLPNDLDDLLGQQQLPSSLQSRRRADSRPEAVDGPEEPLQGDLLALVVRQVQGAALHHTATTQRSDAGEVLLILDQVRDFLGWPSDLNDLAARMADDKPHRDATPVVGSS
jgi:hypothetical protein